MIRLLKALFGPDERRSDLVHFHLDDRGCRQFCDESACRPSNDPLLHTPLALLHRRHW